jgi:hypothetical protein
MSFDALKIESFFTRVKVASKAFVSILRGWSVAYGVDVTPYQFKTRSNAFLSQCAFNGVKLQIGEPPKQPDLRVN